MRAASDRQYEALSRFLVTFAKLRGGPEPADLCIHKRLTPSDNAPAAAEPCGGKSAINEWLADRVSRTAPRHVLDVGCGFGTLAAAINQNCSAKVSGINASRFAISFGREYWSHRTPGKPMRLHHASFGDPIDGGPFDAVVTVEALGYADDLTTTFAWLAKLCAPGAAIWLLDDWAARDLDPQDPDLRAVCGHWHRRTFYTREAVATAALACGFEVTDCQSLTHRVPATQRPPRRLRRWALGLATQVLGASRPGEIARAFLGGWFLESLYARGLCAYELIELRRHAGNA